MIIIGGTYEEYCKYPHHHNIMGSGSRAACVLDAVDTPITLLSAIDKESKEIANVTFGSFSFEKQWFERDNPIIFNYFTPLSSPIIYRGVNPSINISVKEDVVLMFGMIEAAIKVSANIVIYDPQKPVNLKELTLKNIESNHLAIVANKSEIQSLAQSEDYYKSARVVKDKYKAEVVITKMGARGVLITSQEGQEIVGVYPTETVMPIGSGDVFTAGFAWAWAEKKMDATSAAKVGSAAAAMYVSNHSIPLSPESMLNPSNLLKPLKSNVANVYLAGPFFTLSECWLINLVRESLISLGASVFSPYHDIGLGGDEVAKLDIAQLSQSDSVLALLDHEDSGTLFEIGWAHKNGLPIVCFTWDINNENLKMIRGNEIEIHQDLSSAVYRAIWKAMERSSKNV